MIGYDSSYIFARLMVQNIYTNQFATKMELNSSITQTANEINLEVSKKVNNDEIISRINQSSESIQINAEKISLDGKTINLTSEDITIDSNNFSVDSDGNLNCNKGILNDININNGKITLKQKDEIPLLTIEDDDYNSNKIFKHQIVINRNGGMSSVFGTKGSIKLLCNTDYQANAIFNGSDTDDGYNSAEIGTRGISYNIGTVSYFSVSSNGKTFVRDGEYMAWNQFSLESLKKNILKFEKNAIGIIKNADIYEYHYKNERNDDKKHIGFIIGKNYRIPNEILSNTKDGIDTASMISILWKAVQEQQVQIEKLQKELEEIKNDKGIL